MKRAALMVWALLAGVALLGACAAAQCDDDTDQFNFFGTAIGMYDQQDGNNRCDYSIQIDGELFSQYIMPSQIILGGERCSIEGENPVLAETSENCVSPVCAGIKQLLAAQGASGFEFVVVPTVGMTCGERSFPQASIVMGTPCEEFIFSGFNMAADVPVALVLAGPTVSSLCTIEGELDEIAEVSAADLNGDYGSVASVPPNACPESLSIDMSSATIDNNFEGAVYTSGRFPLAAFSTCSDENVAFMPMLSNGRLYQSPLTDVETGAQALFLENLMMSDSSLALFSQFNQSSQFMNFVAVNDAFTQVCNENFAYANGSIGMIVSVMEDFNFQGLLPLEAGYRYIFLQPAGGATGTNNMPQCVYRRQFATVPSPIPTPTPDPNQPTATPAPTSEPESTPTPTPTPVCVDAEWVASNHAGFAVHSEPTFAEVLCFGSLPCATTGHVVSRAGELMTMAELCSVETCAAKSMYVNGVQHVRHHLMPCDGDVCMTTLDARVNSAWKRVENRVVYRLLQSGVSSIAEGLTRIQLRSAISRA
uniref:Uncharacterized protein n=1 Tax=Erythrolobus australicus TaxID=1077150 RepID=A0A7S1XHT7_9RHOD